MQPITDQVPYSPLLPTCVRLHTPMLLAEGDTPKEEQTNLLACLSALPKASISDASPFMKRVHVMENVLELIRRIDRNPAVVGNKQRNDGTSLKSIYRFAVGMYGRQLEALAETFSAERSSQLQREKLRFVDKIPADGR